VFARLWSAGGAFYQMTEVPKSREALSTSFTMPTLALATRQSSSDGTEKLFQLADGQLIETVAIPDDDRMTQVFHRRRVRAPMCSCATGAMGFNATFAVGNRAMRAL
jgi:23S rRNA (adenine2503-C2)-methyltransferase